LDATRPRTSILTHTSTTDSGSMSVNALAESFFASLKDELLHLHAWPTRTAVRRAVVEYIAWYNGTRHSTLGYRSPAEYEEETKIRKVA